MRHLGGKLVFAGIASLMMSACISTYGPEINQFPPATRPAGITSALDLGSDTLHAEILALEEDALIVLVDRLPQHRMAGRLARVPLTGIQTAEFANADGFDYSFWQFFFNFEPLGRPEARPLVHAGSLDPEIRKRLRLLARYPQGVNEELLARLETVYGAMEALGSELGDTRR